MWSSLRPTRRQHKPKRLDHPRRLLRLPRTRLSAQQRCGSPDHPRARHRHHALAQPHERAGKPRAQARGRGAARCAGAGCAREGGIGYAIPAQRGLAGMRIGFVGRASGGICGAGEDEQGLGGAEDCKTIGWEGFLAVKQRNSV